MLFGALLVTWLATSASTGTPPHVIGYVEQGRFLPLLVVDAAQFGPFDARTMALAGSVARDTFADDGAEFPIQAERAYVDASGEPAKYGLAPGRSYTDRFFELDRGAKPRPSSPPSPDLVQSFTRFLAEDDRASELRVLYATDLDRDGKQELWVVYRPAGGGSGRMVWEQRAQAGAWVELADRCDGCDQRSAD